MTAPATSRAGGPGGSSSMASSPAAGPRDGACRLAGQAPSAPRGGSRAIGVRGLPRGRCPRPRCPRAALATVRDPELDEPITRSASSRRAPSRPTGARVWLRLPTYFCALSLSLMVADAYDAVRGRSTEGGWRTTSPRMRSTAAWPRERASPRRSTARRSANCTDCARTSCARPCWPAPTRCAGRCWPPGPAGPACWR
jgi:hypothetical protein